VVEMNLVPTCVLRVGIRYVLRPQKLNHKHEPWTLTPKPYTLNLEP